MNWCLTPAPGPDDHDRHRRIRPALAPRSFDHESYVPGEAAIEAVNTALSLGKPLLVTGEPGVGKTRLAYHVAWRLGLMAADDPARPEVLRFDVKSTTEGQHLLYRYDAIRHFRASRGEGVDPVLAADFIELEALGRGIALAGTPDDRRDVAGGLDAVVRRAVPDADARLAVVLIDEIDKAPRDVPNDLLRELDEMSFKIPELGADAVVRSTSGIRPFVVITSNEEKSLPDPFLRRCCFLHLDYPDPGRMKEIVANQIARAWREAALVADTLAFVAALRKSDAGLRKKPGIAETLDFLRELRARDAPPEARLREVEGGEKLAVALFGKDRDDARRIHEAMRHGRDDVAAG